MTQLLIIGGSDADISEALPYLNAALRGTVYNPAAHVLTWKQGGHNLAFHAYQIAISNVEDRQAAVREIEGLVELVNRTWERRGEIVPNLETHQCPTAMSVFKLLPGTNCKQCGQPTCWSFALKLVAAQVGLDDCAPLQMAAHIDHRTALETVLPPMPAIGRKLGPSGARPDTRRED